jgi:predicted transcriptional regulator
MDNEMMAEALAQILEELRQIKQDIRWLREREEGRRTADHEEMAENLAALGRSIERLKG